MVACVRGRYREVSRRTFRFGGARGGGGSERLGRCLRLGQVRLAVRPEAMVDMIADRRALGGGRGLSHRLKLHGDLRAGAAVQGRPSSIMPMT